MRRQLATLAFTAALGGLLLAGSACGTDSAGASGSSLSEDSQAACDEYGRLINDWSRAYGAEMGAVGEALAAGDEERQEEAVATVRELFETTAHGLHEQADATEDEELAESLHEAGEGMAEIAEQIETYEDVAAAPGLMESGVFATGGGQVNEICAG